MIVVDTNVIAQFLLPSPRSSSCERVHEIDPHWITPRLWVSDFRNVLILYVRNKIISYDKAVEILQFAERLFVDTTFDAKSSDIMKNSMKSTCSAYDLEFVSLAIELGVTLVTMDKQILRQFPSVAVRPEDFC
jgi:predicted nucleic acid-binding protein